MLVIGMLSRDSLRRSGMKSGVVICLLVCVLALSPASLRSQKSGEVQLWLTNADKSALFEQQKPSLQFGKSTDYAPAIEIDDQKTFQTIDGFGFALTGGS